MAVAVLREHLVHGNLGNGKLSLASVGTAEDISQRGASASGRVARGRRAVVLGVLKRGLHGRQGRCRVVSQGEIPEARQLAAYKRLETRRVRRSGDWCVIRGRGQRVVREGRRRGRGRVGRVGPRPLDVAQSSAVVIIVVVSGVRP